MPVLSVTLSSTREIFAIYWHDNTCCGMGLNATHPICQTLTN